MPKRIVIATIGSLGDLHPCLALAVELARRDHCITVASTPYYKSKIEALGIAFSPLRPAWNPADPELIRQCEDLKRGPEILYRKLILPGLSETYEDLLFAASRADLLIAGELVYAAPLVAEKLGLRWVSLILSPFSFFSCSDPSVMVNVPNLIHLRKLGSPVYRIGLNIGRLATRHWSNPVRDLRRRRGLRVLCDPVFRDKFSPHLVLALFSHWLAQQQADWPRQTLQSGFVHFEHSTDADPRLSEFLRSGDPPIVFTQGSTAVHNPGEFYAIGMKAAKLLCRRAMLVGAKGLPVEPAPNCLALPYTPYSQIFPYASGDRAPRRFGHLRRGASLRPPMLIVPYGWDQPDNATRLERLGVALHLPRVKYSVDTATAALKKLLEQSDFAIRAREIGGVGRKRPGAGLQCH